MLTSFEIGHFLRFAFPFGHFGGSLEVIFDLFEYGVTIFTIDAWIATLLLASMSADQPFPALLLAGHVQSTSRTRVARVRAAMSAGQLAIAFRGAHR